MLALLKKELRSFFSSVVGYIVIIVFLGINCSFLWIVPSNTNIIDSGYASIDSFFDIAPWVFLFLVPAITMRLFAEEERSGTLELLFTQPISDIKIILSKYFASIILVWISIIPTFIYFISVYFLSNPVGNIDLGATWGSYIGLFFLVSIYCAIGLFASSITKNQIIAFIVGMFFCFLFYIGFDYISGISIFSAFQMIIINFGINEHYVSISRGVLDSKDVIYFICVNIIFVLTTRFVLESRKW